MSQIALAAGFDSLRRYNAVFSEIYGRPPTDLRRRLFGWRSMRKSRAQHHGGRQQEVVSRCRERVRLDARISRTTDRGTSPAPWLCRSGRFPDQARNYHAIPRRSHGGRGYRNAWSVSGAGIRPRISSNLPIHPVRQGLDRYRLNQPRWLALLHRSFDLLRCCIGPVGRALKLLASRSVSILNLLLPSALKAPHAPTGALFDHAGTRNGAALAK
jgi:hypothetical protein